MAGLSSINCLQSKETSSNLPSLMTKKLMLRPQRLPPIGFEGPKTVTQPPPPPPTPVPWSWYHRNCSKSPRSRGESSQATPPPPTPAARPRHHRNHAKNLKPLLSLSRHNRQQNNTKKTSTSPRSSEDELWSLYELLSGRTHLLMEYVLRFWSPSERGALVQVLQRHSGASSADSTSRLQTQWNCGPMSEKEYSLTNHRDGSWYLSYRSSSSTIDVSEQSSFGHTESDDARQETESTDLESERSFFTRTVELMNNINKKKQPMPQQPPNAIFLTCKNYSSKKIYSSHENLRSTTPSAERDVLKSPKHSIRDVSNKAKVNDKVMIPLSSRKDTSISPRSKKSASHSSSENGTNNEKSSEEPLIPQPRRLPVPTKLLPTSGSQLPREYLTPKSAPSMSSTSVATQTSTAVRSAPTPRRLPTTPGRRPTFHHADIHTSTAVRSAPMPRRLPTPPGHKPTTNIHENRHIAYPPFKMDEKVIIEMWCKNARTQEELLLLRKLPELVSDTLKYQRMYQSLLQESQMSEFLLQVAQAIFEEMVSLDQLIKKILEVAQRLVSADRASLFLVDHKNFELVSTVFDLRYESNNDSDFSKKEIRMPINKGIAGHVAMSGETMNIPDAYSDERFNKAVDEATGYRTVSILCMPIKVRGKVIAVVQMVNKRDKDAFGNDDEAAFQVFSTFFGLALHHARLYDKIKRKEQKYKVALEVLGYHNSCAEEDVMNLLEERNKEEKINYNDFALNPFEVDDVEKCKGILTMFDDLFDITKFDVTVLARFVLTVKKNYRKVPYHNFDHGWAVANAMYVMLKHDMENRFDYNNRLALFVASLCHDLDHRGYTNKFMSEIASPLATIYTTSTLEHHHFNMTVTILQQDGHNIFNHMSSEGYKDMLDSIRQCILATDLATLFPNLKKINELVFETPQFDWNDVNHSALARSFSMTCADLCAAAKPFEVQLVTAKIITAEFYQQGDLERQAGRTPIPMMDRSRPEELPACQVGFLSQICTPCYTVLNKLFPTTEPMLIMTKQNLEIWKARASAIEEKNKNQ